MKEEKTKAKIGVMMQNNDFDQQRKTSPLMRDMPRPKNATFVDMLEVKAREQKKIPLGSYTEDTQPKGFLVEVDPDPSPANAVITEITSLGSGSRYTLYLVVSNFSSKAVHVEAWRL